MEREEMRWLGHISRMTPDTSTTHARTFARSSIDVGNFARQASSDGGRISADRRVSPRFGFHCHKHGFGEADVERWYQSATFRVVRAESLQEMQRALCLLCCALWGLELHSSCRRMLSRGQSNKRYCLMEIPKETSSAYSHPDVDVVIASSLLHRCVVGVVVVVLVVIVVG